MTGAARIRAMRPPDWPAVEAIYRAGIDTGNATFETDPPEWEHFDTAKLDAGRLVAVDDAGTVVGWIAVSPVSSREVYRGVVEHSVYVSPDAAGRGVGLQLVEALVAAMEDAGVWTIQSSIFPENGASLAVHDRAGFRVVGHRERIALMTYGPWAGTWRDTLLIERRSTRR
ncbi:GNAT family N-acetyltransferase [Cnuibacter physcomitrellae]|uniref:GNAT family N-acetyltransferase n=1 Tax=Cnuibacter physcomitrellae TaxID=1619308 RepID=UPI0021757285|nr:GNAT family N-acetyltransferase [Cnuibacter physcomitrellae]MCS5498541.1 GNAT family N-acetyltransferase [Cnuibacter physcomitrellae]